MIRSSLFSDGCLFPERIEPVTATGDGCDEAGLVKDLAAGGSGTDGTGVRFVRRLPLAQLPFLFQ